MREGEGASLLNSTRRSLVALPTLAASQRPARPARGLCGLQVGRAMVGPRQGCHRDGQ